LENNVAQFAKYLDKRSKSITGTPQIEHNSFILQEENELEEELSQLISDMHLRGINVRYLLLLYKNLNENYNKILVLIELVARVVKKHVEEKWRDLKSDKADDYQKVILDFLNLVFGNTNESIAYWENNIKETMKYFEILRIGIFFFVYFFVYFL
jgi:hypothetical protein